MVKKDEQLIPLLSQILDVPAETLHDDSDLMHFGLDSMRIMRVATQLRRAGIGVTFADLIGKRSLREWRQVVAAAGQHATPGAPEGDAPPDAPFELATMQHAFWVGRNEQQQLGGVSAHFYTELEGDALEPARLADALRRLVARHDMLRLRIDDDIRQHVSPDSPCVLSINDLRDLPVEQCAARLSALRQRFTHQQLDIANGETLMLSLSLLPEGRSRLHIDLDMIAGDAASLRVLLRDLALLYQNPDQPLPPLTLSYAQYLRRQRQAGQSRREQDRLWWQPRVAQLAQPPALPLQPGENGKPTAERRYLWLDDAQSRQLTAFSQRAGLTVPAVLATLFSEVIGLWSGGEPFLLNLPVFSREQDIAQIEHLVGDFSSSVLINVDPGQQPDFIAQAAQLQARLHEALAHSAWSGVDVLRDASRLHRGQTALAPVVFTSALALGEIYVPQVRDLLGEPVWSISQGPQVWIDAQATEYRNGILLNWDVRADLFAPGALDAMFGAFQQYVERLAHDETHWRRPLASPVPVVPWPVENVVSVPDCTPLYLRFFSQAQAQPEAVALCWGEDGCMRYDELAQRALRVAHFLQQQGVGVGSSVAVSMGKGHEQTIAVLGILAAGAAYVPCGIDIPLARREDIYRDAGVALVLSDSRASYQPVWPADVAVFPLSLAWQETPLSHPVAVDGDRTMYVIFTSGSTGAPKGVEVSHRAVANTVDAVDQQFALMPQDCTLTLSELDFDLSAYDMFAFLSRGASLAVVDETERRDAHAWLALLQRWPVSVISCVPTLLDMLLTAAGDTPLPTLRLVMMGGDRIPVTLASRWWRLCGGAPFVGLGGMTETAIHATSFVLHADDPRWSSVPYGQPLRNMYCRIVDARGRDCPAWVAGELWVSGPGLANGYRNDAERTAEKFVLHAGRRWYRSGDRVRYWPDGVIEYLGRTDHQVKIRGHRIEPGEVEAALMRHPAVLQACVTVVEHAARQLNAALVVTEEMGDNAWRQWLQRTLPPYAIPEHYQVLSELPLTVNGKVDRTRLRRLAELQLASHRTANNPPEGNIECEVAALWCELLKVDAVSREDNFFVLGGDSLIATRLITALRERHLAAPLQALFVSPSLYGFCQHIHPCSSAPLPVIAADDAGRYDPFPLSDIQRAFWIGRSEQMTLGGVGSHFYIEFDGDALDVPRLERAWQRLIERHDMLRAVVTEEGQQQVLAHTAPYRFRRLDAEEDVETTLQVWRDALSHRVYDVTQWPLFDIQVAQYHQVGEIRHRLMVSLDTIMLDGRSIMVLFTEWDRLYQYPDAQLAPLDIQYRDYVLWQSHSGQQQAQQAKAYWRERLHTLPDAPALPLAVQPESISQPRFRRWRYAMSPDQWKRFGAQAQRHGITPSVALAAVYGEILSYWSNQPELALNLTLFDRQPVHPHIDHVVGDFASILLLGYQAAQGIDFYQVAMRLQQQEGEGLSQRTLSGIQILRELARYKNQTMATMPVVFTSVLGLAKDASLDLSDRFPALYYAISQTPQVWLDAKVSESRGYLLIEWDVLEALFPPGMIDAMFAAYCRLVEHLAQAEWHQPLTLALPPEQQRLRTQINQTALDFGDATPLYLRVFAQAQRTPQTMALVWGERGGMDYRTLARQALCVGGYLIRQGMQPGDRVAISHAKGVQQIVAVLGVLAAGGCYVPCGIDLPLARRDAVYRRAAVRWVLTDGDSLARLDWPTSVPVVALSEALLSAPLPQPVIRPLDAPMYIIFTSGTTGTPKGVVVSHGAVANTIDAVARRFDLATSDRSITLSALDFDLSAYDIFTFLSAGGSLAVVSEGQQRDAAAWVDLINRWQVSVISAVPALVEMIAIAARATGLPQTLRLVMVGGDCIPRQLPEMLWALAPQLRFAALGGMTEAAIHATCYDVTPDDEGWAAAPFGAPLANMRCRVVDYQERDCPDGVNGELWISGTGLADGYYGDAMRSAEKFVTRQGNVWYRTGDVACYRCDGMLMFSGRADSQVKIRGHRIELAEVEGSLTRLSPIEAAVAVVIDGPSRQLAAAIVCGADTDMAQIKTAMQAWLPEYAVPEHLIPIERVPLSANGKVDREAVAARVAEHLLHERDTVQGRAPESRAERAIAALWCELLGVEAVGLEDNFFGLGGDSLIATRLMTRLPEAGYRGTLASLFRQPMLRAFAATVNAVKKTSPQCLIHDAPQRYAPFPLSEVQQAYWLGRRQGFTLGGIAAQCYHEYELPGLDIVRMEHAWNRLVIRHDMLRCAFDADGRQRILPEVPYYYFRYHDLRHLADPSMQLALLREQMAHHTLAPESGRLYDLEVIDYGDGQTRLAVLFDNLIVDGLSMLTLLSELFQCYQEPECELPLLTVAFRDYQCWREQQGCSEEAQAYWAQRLERLPPAPALPTCVEPAAIRLPRFRRLEARLEQELWRQLTDRARQAQITPSVLLLTCFAETLSRWSAQQALIVNMTLFDRQPLHPDINQVVGDFTSLILAEYHADSARSWLSHAQRLQAQVWQDIDHQEVSAIAVLRQLAQRRGDQTHPAPVVFTSMLGVADSLVKAAPWPDYTCSQTPQVWLDHQAIDLADGVLLSWDYLEELFPADMVEQMFAWYCQTLRSLAAGDWHAPPMRQLPEAQRQARLRVNATAGPSPAHHALHEAFFQQALLTPERTAIWEPSGDSICYGVLREQALSVAAALQQQGMGPGDSIALCMARGGDAIVALLGILAAGAAYVPINPSHPAARRALLCRRAYVKAVISALPLDIDVPVFGLDALRAAEPLPEPVIPPDDATAYVIFTSGSTGTPKGVVVEHRNVLNTLEDMSQRYDVNEHDVFLAVAALDFDLSVFDIFGALSKGARLVLTPEEQQRDAEAWLSLMQAQRISVWNSVPPLFEMLLEMTRVRATRLPALRLVLLSGDWVNPHIGESLQQVAPQAQAVALGGATEAGIWSNAWPLAQSLPDDWRTVPYGLPLRNQRFRVVDGLGNDAPDWVPGELWIGGQSVARGYCGDEEQTRLQFSGNFPWRWYRTGDRGRYRADGVLEFLGRSDGQIKLLGHRIELGEIEHHLRGHRRVRHAIAVLQGAGAKARLLAFVQLNNQGLPEQEVLTELNAHLRAHLPNYAVPSELVPLTHWPLTANGKIDRRQLAARQTQTPQHASAVLHPLQREIVTIWQGVLDGDAPGEHDSFFRVGGNSLLGTRLVAQLCDHFSIRLTLREFFADATISGLCVSVERHLADNKRMEEGLL